jgi:hypothetical protein
MKYQIEKQGDEFRVMDETKSVIVGTHSTEGAAEEQIAALVNSLETYGTLYELANVHIFNVGEWNGKKYSTADLDEIVSAFAEVGYRPPVKIGHSDDDSAPAYGWIRSVKRIGDGLFADFMDLPESVFTAIKDRRYDIVSSEIWTNLKRGGKTFSKALKAVSLLGSAIPGVNLKPLRDCFTMQTDAVAITYKFKSGDLEMPQPNTIKPEDFTITTLESAQTVVADLIAKFNALAATHTETDKTELAKMQAQLDADKLEIARLSAENQARDIDAAVSKIRIPAYRGFFKELYSVAMAPALAATVVKFSADGKDPVDTSIRKLIDLMADKMNADAVALFSQVPDLQNDLIDDGGKDGETAGDKVARLAAKYSAEHPEVDYMSAIEAVLNADKELKTAYLSKEKQ